MSGKRTKSRAVAPSWYRDAMSVPKSDDFIDVNGCRIHYLTWGEPNRRGILFVHGGGAHAHWWTHIAARYAEDYRVAAIDLSGHGDSGRRAVYRLEDWTDEVIAVAEASEMVDQPIIIGHSLGGFVVIVTAALHSASLSGAIVCDSPISEPNPEMDAARAGQAFGKPRLYTDRETALARFRTIPPQDNCLDYVMADIAARSLLEVEGGFKWKFDHVVFSAFEGNPRAVARPYLKDITCRLALLRAENGLVTQDIGDYMYDSLGRVNPLIEIPEAGHHLMLDQPLLLITAINTLLADWDHSMPHTRSR